jgi:ParB family chromosome partitioning protein
MSKKFNLQDRIAQATSRRAQAEESTPSIASSQGVKEPVIYGKSPSPTPAEKSPIRTGPGTMMAHLEDRSAVHIENKQLKDQLAKWDGASPARKIDSALVVPSKWANRNADSFLNAEFSDFKTEIESSGGNIQPIKVRPIADTDKFEVIFGHRRHRACSDLGMPVLAIVEDATEHELFEAMDRENRQRADLRPYEQGEMYRRALDEGLYPSMRKLCELVGANQGNASIALRIARMPQVVLDAFNSRLDIQFRWGLPLANAIDANPDAVLAVAKTIQQERGGGAKLPPSEVFDRLIAKPAASANVRGIEWGGKSPMVVKQDGEKISFSLRGVCSKQAAAIEKAILAVLKG